MKTLIQKLPLDEGRSFIARTYSTPDFETPFHQHNEYELMVIKEGCGKAFVGNTIGEYRKGDVYLHGANLPHWFRKRDSDSTGSSMVIQFQHSFLGDKFMALPEMNSIRNLLNNSAKGIFLLGNLRKNIGKRIIQIENKKCFLKLIDLLTLLYEISDSSEYQYVCQSEIRNFCINNQGLIHKVFEYTFQNFKRKVLLTEVASLTNKSVSAFCHYFKKNTKLTYIEFLTQLRISHACSLLKNTELPITEICYESGFQNWANFSTHFKRYAGMSPKAYRTISCQNKI